MEELRGRLEEAEEALRAIRSGEVDGLVVSTAQGDQVFTLSGADFPYRVLIEEMNEGAFTMAMDGTILYCNSRFAEMVKKPLEQVINSSFFRFIAPGDRAAVNALIYETVRKGGKSEIQMIAADGSTVPVYFSASFLEMGGAQAIGAVVTDLTEQRRNERILKGAKLANSILNQSTDLIFVCDETGRIVRVSNGVYSHFQSVLKQPFDSACPLAIVSSPSSQPKQFFISSVLSGVVIRSLEVAYRQHDAREQYFLLSAMPLTDDKKQMGCVITLTDITTRKRAEETLRKAHEELEKRIGDRTAELAETVEKLQAENIQRKRLEETLRESEMQVRFFASQCLTAQETERKRVAGELHDSIAAALSALKFGIGKAAEEMKQGADRPEALEDLGSKVTDITNEVRRIMADLRPSILDDLGIIAAMNWFCREYQKTYSHITVENEIGISEDEVPNLLKTPIFRISQEAMNNIAKYSKASFVNLSLQKKDGKLQLTIQDNGQGFDLERVRKGLGLSTMRERAHLSGGSFDLHSTVGSGTIIRAEWSV